MNTHKLLAVNILGWIYFSHYCFFFFHSAICHDSPNGGQFRWLKLSETCIRHSFDSLDIMNLLWTCTLARVATWLGCVLKILWPLSWITFTSFKAEEPLWGDTLILITKSPWVTDSHLTIREMMKGWVTVEPPRPSHPGPLNW